MNEHCFIICESSSDCEHCVFTCVLSVLSGVLAEPHLTPQPPVPYITLQLLSSGEVLADPRGPKPMGESGALVSRGTSSPRPESQPGNLACPTQASMGRSYILTRQRLGPAWLCWGSLQRFRVISPSLTPLPNHHHLHHSRVSVCPALGNSFKCFLKNPDSQTALPDMYMFSSLGHVRFRWFPADTNSSGNRASVS